MKADKQNWFKLPMAHWLFFLFLCSGVSGFQERLLSGKPDLVENVDPVVHRFRQTAATGQYSCQSAGKACAPKRISLGFLHIKILSRHLDHLTKLTLRTQSLSPGILPQNTIQHLYSRNLPASDDNSDFIS